MGKLDLWDTETDLSTYEYAFWRTYGLGRPFIVALPSRLRGPRSTKWRHRCDRTFVLRALESAGIVMSDRGGVARYTLRSTRARWSNSCTVGYRRTRP